MAVAMFDPTAMVPVLENALELAEEAVLAQQDSQEKLAAKDHDIVALRQQIAEQEKVILEKVAKTQALNPVELDRLFDKFEDLNIMTPRERVKLAAHIQRDPNLVFPLFLKAAEMLSGAPAEGAGISRDETGAAPSIKDPDGWDDWVEGKPVQLKEY